MAKGISTSPTHRRLSTGRAGHDCFACTKQRLQCDRQRPYCSQCLADCNQCPGYQVSLTWGVGIASRGKLRGQTCPVPQNNPSPSSENHGHIEGQLHGPNLSGLVRTANSFQWDNDQSNLSTESFSEQDIQSTSYFLESYTESEAETPVVGTLLPYSLGDIHPEHDHTRDLMFSDYSQGSCGNSERMTTDIKETWKNSSPLFSPNENHSLQHCPENAGMMPPLTTSISQTLIQTWPGSTPRVRYLVNYFSQRIASNLVQFDHIPNPFQSFILCMAYESEMLQRAIAAIAASHIQQQAEVDLASPTSSQSLKGELVPGEDARGPEDLMHRTRAVQCLNEQLADVRHRYKDDIVVAFLLLVLYHLCKTGVSNLQSQLSAARKLLELRQRGRADSSHVTYFCIQMFTWIDTLTSMINSRPGTFSNPYLAIACQGGGDWTLDNTTGCDGLLFQEIARLSQLRSFLNDEQYHTDFGGVLLEEARSRIESWDRISAGCNNLSSLSPGTCSPHSDTSSTTRNSNAIESKIVAISELFRHASLIYCQRILSPELPSSHYRVQNLVSRALEDMENIDWSSRVLWPLLIVGFECIYAEQQNIVRRKLRGILRLSGFAIHRQALYILQNIWDTLEMENLSVSADISSGGLDLYSDIHNNCIPRNGWTIWRALNDSKGPNQGCAIF
ncbi:fungal-specific transcription factor domain-containing protein [Talaromyces proteolyticus]|uniref:Fungal-specific transcription factor domain-containing protein n=1 Tax=Talaromyces proteolyticus TaxID=1131652 RepID=A0AAD4L1A7_9EURO|nr:fungal-specific transcription factor domain-containing protein [Talaromyces proteolyticus]KAH8702296.1 fungal-specific transcription factor domain-containing protein [Talaromyces proteolyticus]